MTDRLGTIETTRPTSATAWAFRPPIPIEAAPVFVWPPRPMEALRYLLSLGFLGSLVIPLAVLASLSWFFLQPSLERCAVLQIDWIAQIYARNLGLLLLVAGGLHLYFYTFKRQGARGKFDARDLADHNPKFFARNQVRDNMLWSCGSGVTVWTAYEIGFMWAYANEKLPFFLDVWAHPVWFFAAFLWLPFWSSLQFGLGHRLLHWRPLYTIAHSVQHRNDNIGPWSGFSMHPIEHVIYISSVLIHLVVLSHPIHVLYHLQWKALVASMSHAGFESLRVKGRPILLLGSFHHQLHHRFYDCNYGASDVPIDRWFGWNHDGTEQAWNAIVERRRARIASAGNKT